MFGWTRLGREVDQAAIFSKDDIVAVKRAKTLSTETPQPIAKPEFKKIVVPPTEIPARAFNWTLSKHAEDQLKVRGPEYGITRNDVLLACSMPTHTYESYDDPSRFRYVRDRVSLVVNPRQKRVITVMPNAQEWGREIERRDLAPTAS